MYFEEIFHMNITFFVMVITGEWAVCFKFCQYNVLAILLPNFVSSFHNILKQFANLCFIFGLKRNILST